MENDGQNVEVEGEMEIDGQAAGVEGEMENDGNTARVESEMEIDGQAVEGVEIQLEAEEHEVSTERFEEGLVDSGFEYEEETTPTQDPQPSTINMDLGLDDIAGQQGNGDDTDYVTSD
ncbi:hypothetical protein Adt_06226 [Abeliophyllum distichum]|uniref:Uncharacterized protein n=1 Tax=Abeliophyllum distichum TaxID=126358 RepID=A0ABD1V6B3_9LAMI